MLESVRRLPRMPRFYLSPQLRRLYFLGHRDGLGTDPCDFSTLCKIQHLDLKGEKMLLITTPGPFLTQVLPFYQRHTGKVRDRYMAQHFCKPTF